MRERVRKPTILDVAREAGVSVGSVSNVLNGTGRVSPQLRTAVMEVANALGYQTNTLAQALRRRRSKVVGLATTHTTTTYLEELADAFDAVAADQGYDLIQVFTRQDPERELRRVRALLSRQVDGLILLPSLDPHASLDAIVQSGTPAVVVDRLCADPRFDYVVIDNRRAMADIVRHLIALGHERLLFVAQRLAVVTTRHRIEGLEGMLRETGGRVRAEIIERGEDEDAFVRRLSMILDAPAAPTAIITGNSSVALWTLKALKTLRVSYPKRLSLATFDDPEWGSITDPPLSTVRYPIEEIARTAWALLLDRIGGTQHEPQQIAVKADLIHRGSTKSPGSGD